MQKSKNKENQSTTKSICKNLIFFKMQNLSPCSLFKIFRFQNVFFLEFLCSACPYHFYIILPYKIKQNGCIFMHKLSYARGLVGSCREAFFECWASKVNKTTLFCTKIQFWDVKVKFFLFHLLLTLRMDFYCHQKYARYLHTLGVKTQPLVEIYLIFFSVRIALKVLFLNSWDIFSLIFWSIFSLFLVFLSGKNFKNPT